MNKLIVAASAALAFVCASAAHAQTAPAAPTQGAATSQRPARHNRNRIEQDEIAASHASNAYELVQSLRSSWLNRHRPTLTTVGGNGMLPDLIVIMDGSEIGTNGDALRQVNVTGVFSVEYLTPAELYSRYDRNARDGAVVVHTTPNDDPGYKPTT